MEELRERLDRMEKLLHQIHEWMLTHQRPVASIEIQFDRMENEIARVRERVVALEAQAKVKVWVVSLISSVLTAIVVWLILHVLGGGA